MGNKILVIAGSNSKNSINKSLATYAAHQLKDVTYDVANLSEIDLPVYGIDLEKEHGIPEAAKNFKNYIDEYDGFIISLAEHNGSYTSSFKNLIDWLSRIEKKIFGDKPVLLMSASPGPRGGKNVLNSASVYFPFLGADLKGIYSFPNYHNAFSASEGIKEEDKRIELIESVDKLEKAVCETGVCI